MLVTVLSLSILRWIRFIVYFQVTETWWEKSKQIEQKVISVNNKRICKMQLENSGRRLCKGFKWISLSTEKQHEKRQHGKDRLLCFSEHISPPLLVDIRVIDWQIINSINIMHRDITLFCTDCLKVVYELLIKHNWVRIHILLPLQRYTKL